MEQARLILEGVLSDDVPKVWDLVAPLLQKCLNETAGEYDLPATLVNLLARDWQLWLGVTAFKGDIKAVAVTEIVYYPKRKVCRFIMLSGTGADSILKLRDDLAAWAMSFNCVGIEAWCRPGMAKLLVERAGFSPKYHVVTLDLKRSLQ